MSNIVDYVPSDCWRHVDGLDNPADCASRGLLPSELLKHKLWWNGPKWLSCNPESWPNCLPVKQSQHTEEERSVCLASSIHPITPIISLDRYSSFNRLKYVTGWIMRFIRNCRNRVNNTSYEGNAFMSVNSLTPVTSLDAWA